ncbi:MAG: BrnT family toxin [Hyphomicrobiaceae bacterium]
MQDDEFEWDDEKAQANLKEHGVSFEAAKLVFKDPFAFDWTDDREEYGEDRSCIIGAADGRILFVAYTERNGRTRIISARGAEPHERRQYHEENSS